MSRHLGAVTALLLMLTAVSNLAAQPVVVGELAAGEEVRSSVLATFLDIAHPANATGSLTTATVRIAGAPCSSSFKVRFYRPSFSGVSASLTMIEERGPFPMDAATKTVALTPPVNVQKNDLMGVFQPASSVCSVANTYRGGTEVGILVPADYTGGPISDLYPNRSFHPSFRASSDAFALVGFIPAVGSVAGLLGSQFRTSFQVTNPSDMESVSLKFVFHPRGSAATPSDPSTGIVVNSRATNSDNLLQSMGASGLGSLDVYSKTWAPTMAVRVFNDAGSSGTSGFSQGLIVPFDTLHAGEHGQIVFPADLTNYRMNIGIRTLDAGLTLRCTFFDAGGANIGNSSNVYPANFFDQVSLQTFFSAAAANGSADCQPLGGDAILYTSTTDNRTQDSAVTIVPRR